MQAVQIVVLVTLSYFYVRVEVAVLYFTVLPPSPARQAGMSKYGSACKTVNQLPCKPNRTRELMEPQTETEKKPGVFGTR